MQTTLISQRQSNYEKPGRLIELEAFRGIAAILIIVFHMYQHSRLFIHYPYEPSPIHTFLVNLDVGISCFFVLSGFLIFLPFATAISSQQNLKSSRAFLIRRAIRILPAYYLAFLAVWTWNYAGLHAQRIDLIEHLTFTHIFDLQYIFWTIGPAWSLANEVWFYLMIAILGPILYKMGSKLNTPRKRNVLLISICIALITLSIGYKWWAMFVAQIPLQNYPTYFGPFAMLDTFVFGMLLAVLKISIENKYPLSRYAPPFIRLAGFAILVAAFITRNINAFFTTYFYTISTLGFLFILASTVQRSKISYWKRILSNRVFQFLGLISYSLYLWHEPILIELDKHHLIPTNSFINFLISTFIVILISTAAATMSYWMIEYPAMLLKHLFNNNERIVNFSKSRSQLDLHYFNIPKFL